MLTLKKLGKALLAVGIVMMVAAPAMAGNGQGGTAKGSTAKCSCLTSVCGCPVDSPCLDL